MRNFLQKSRVKSPNQAFRTRHPPKVKREARRRTSSQSGSYMERVISFTRTSATRSNFSDQQLRSAFAQLRAARRKPRFTPTTVYTKPRFTLTTVCAPAWSFYTSHRLQQTAFTPTTVYAPARLTLTTSVDTKPCFTRTAVDTKPRFMPTTVCTTPRCILTTHRLHRATVCTHHCLHKIMVYTNHRLHQSTAYTSHYAKPLGIDISLLYNPPQH